MEQFPSNSSGEQSTINQDQLVRLAAFVKSHYGIEVEPTVEAIKAAMEARKAAQSAEEKQQEDLELRKKLGVSPEATAEEIDAAALVYLEKRIRLMVRSVLTEAGVEL